MSVDAPVAWRWVLLERPVAVIGDLVSNLPTGVQKDPRLSPS